MLILRCGLDPPAPKAQFRVAMAETQSGPCSLGAR